MGYALGRLYIDNFFDRSIISDVENMAENVRQAFYEIIHDNLWLDSKTKSNALEKIRLLKFKIGYPEWIFDDQKLNDYYSDLNLPQNSNVKSTFCKENSTKLSSRWGVQKYFVIGGILFSIMKREERQVLECEFKIF